MSVSGRRTTWLLALIVIAGATVRFWSLDYGLPLIKAHPDENFVIEAARSLLSRRLPNFFDYPWFYIYMVSVGYVGYFVWGLVTGTFSTLAETIASWPVHWEPFFIISRSFSAIFGTLSILVIFRLGRQLRSTATGLLAALFLALAFMPARDSHFGTTDVTMTFFILSTVSLLVDGQRSGRRRAFVLAGITAGLAAATKYNGGLLGVPVVASLMLMVLERPAAWRTPLLHVLALGLAFAITFGFGVPFVVIDQERFLAAMRELSHAVSVGDPVVSLGNGWLHHLRFSLRYAAGVPFLVTGLAGAVFLAAAQPRESVLWLSFPIAYFVVAGSVGLLFFRYVLPIVPFLCLTAAYLLARLAEAAIARGLAPPVASTAATVVALLIIAPSAANIVAFDRIIGRTDNRIVVANWFSEHAPPGGTVAISGGRYGYVQFEQRLGLQVWQWDGGRNAFMYANRRTAGKPDWILVQDSPLPSMTQPIVATWITEDYVFVQDFKALENDGRAVYDRLDSFYMPFAGFDALERPGPNFSLYRRTPATAARDTTVSR